MKSYGRVLPDAWRIILPIWGVTLFVLILSDEVVLNLFLLALSAGVAALFYIPKRVPFEQSENLLIAPVDGVLETVETDVNGMMRLRFKKGLFDSSVVRAPLSGSLQKSDVRHGLFLSLHDKKSLSLNEQMSIDYQWYDESVTMRLQCGLYAFSLLRFCHVGDVEVGDIQAHLTDGYVELLIPSEVKIEVSPGDQVMGGYSVIARRAS
ncbi:MAG: hypothetical protein DSY46_03145 [Hydrogenimonas sp.]|nr:MAG: hypothetical protein DSY46_03145 [Hydrogenimonas sp.]